MGQSPTAVDVSIRLGYLAAPANVPASKLGMGIAFYGNCWHDVTGPRQDGGSISDSDGTMSYANIATKYPVATKRFWDTLAHVPYLSSATPMGPQSCNFVSYDDEQSIAEKGAYARAKGLGGVIIWTISQGHVAALPAGQRDPLLSAVHTAFRP